MSLTMNRSAATDIDLALAETERAGLRLVLTIRSVIVFLGLVSILTTQGWERGLYGASIVSMFLIIGIIYFIFVINRRDRIWMRYAFVTLDLALLAWVAVSVPLSLNGDVPQIFVFRVYSVGIFFFILATSALSLSPALVLWSGAGAILASWGVWGWIVLKMDRVVTWRDFSVDPTAENYVRLVLDPDHINLSGRTGDSILIAATAIVTAAAVQRARTLLRRQIATERQRAEVTEVFGRFVPEEVVDSLSHSGGVLPSEEREATVMFVDIEGFTGISERLDPHEIVTLLDAFFEDVSAIAARHKGVSISLIGDAALIAFNAPLNNLDHAASALACAQELLERVRTKPFSGHQLTIRIGVASGLVAAGTVGGGGRRSYTLYGDTVNLAQRLEALNKTMGTHLLTDAPTYNAASKPEGLRPLNTIQVKGRSEPVQVFGPRSEPAI